MKPSVEIDNFKQTPKKRRRPSESTAPVRGPKAPGFYIELTPRKLIQQQAASDVTDEPDIEQSHYTRPDSDTSSAPSKATRTRGRRPPLSVSVVISTRKIPIRNGAIEKNPKTAASLPVGPSSRGALSSTPAENAPDTSNHTRMAVDGEPNARVVYEVAEDELKEGKDLHVIGETEASDNDDSSDEEDDIPVRILSDFAVYTLDSQEMVPIAELITADELLSLYGASGNVRPWVEEEQEETDDGLEEDDTDDDSDVHSGGQRVKLSAILELSMHHVSEETGMLDRKIYIRTQFAWYILSMPTDLYTPFFAQFWLKHRLLHLIVSHAMENPRISMDQFVQDLNSSEESLGTVSAQDILGRHLTEEDLRADDVKSYILATLEDLQAQGIKLGRVPLIRGLFPADTAETAPGARLESAVSLPGKRSKVVRAVDRQQDESVVQNLEMEVLKHRNITMVLPTVKRLADGLFDHPLKVIANDRAETARAFSNMDVDPPVIHLANPKMTWRERDVGAPGHYSSANIDGVVYTVGDVVIVEPGFDMDSTRARNAVNESAQSRNSLGNCKWFAKICYMFERDGKKWFHGQWYAHGSKTLLQELAHSRSLYIMNLCDDIELNTVIQKCNVVQLAADEVEPAEDESSAENNFFESSLSWDEDESAFVELSERTRDEALFRCKPWKPCVPCGLRAGEDLQNKLVVRHNGFAQYGIEYHVNDCVYLYHGRHPDNPYEFGQILEFEDLEDVESFKVVVQLLGRWDDIVRRERRDNPNAAPEPKDERQLFATSKTATVKPERIAGKCFVVRYDAVSDIGKWLQHSDHYYVKKRADSPNVASYSDFEDLATRSFLSCPSCHKTRHININNKTKLLKEKGPLQGLELFAGAGGLSTGMDDSGFVQTKWAVEFSPSCSLTMRKNHPTTIIYNQCCNLLLEHAVNTLNGKQPSPLLSLHDNKTQLPPMPEPGDVDFIFGGLPCQSYSGANHHKKADDPRSTLVCNMMSYVEFYRPAYFLLENVLGLLMHPLKAEQDGPRLVGGYKNGVVKFIVRSLTSLGYQVRFKVVQAGQYGAPQGRRRVIFWGARRGVPLPSFPLPTHYFFQNQTFTTLPTGVQLAPVTRSLIPGNYNQGAPLYPVTIDDAIGDLPPFDWQDPHDKIPETPKAHADVKIRAEAGIIAFYAGPGPSHYPGFYNATLYPSPPLNRFQMNVRRYSDGLVKHQYTKRFTNDVIERVVNVPIRSGADWSNLPRALHLGERVSKRTTIQHMCGIYERVDPRGHFRTAMTSVSPNSKGSCCIHPTQKRIFTIRECARAQGFPDHWEILSINTRAISIINDQHRQIGNAVPVPLALALGNSLGDALIKLWEQEERAESPEV